MGERVRYPSNGGTSEGYLARPAGGTGPGVIVIQEWWGLVPHITALADRFAEAGFVALAPDLYHGVQATEPDDAGRLLMGLAMEQAARDIAGAAEHLASLPETVGGIGCVGFCMGGSLALWSATLSPRIITAVGFYPSMPWERMGPTWANYEHKHALIHCDGHGTSTTPGIRQAVQAIEGVGGAVTVYDYPGTHHAFFNDDRPEAYDRAAASTAWARTLERLRATL